MKVLFRLDREHLTTTNSTLSEISCVCVLSRRQISWVGNCSQNVDGGEILRLFRLAQSLFFMYRETYSRVIKCTVHLLFSFFCCFGSLEIYHLLMQEQLVTGICYPSKNLAPRNGVFSSVSQNYRRSRRASFLCIASFTPLPPYSWDTEPAAAGAGPWRIALL